MKNSLLIILSFITFNTYAQTDFYSKKGVAIDGYDVTEYFNGTAKEGLKKYSTKYDGYAFYFTSEANQKKFEANPEKFIPQYGGYCAYAIGLKSEKVKINPKTFEIRDGKLYLFYNSWGTNTLDLWLKEGATELKSQADVNWEKIKDKK